MSERAAVKWLLNAPVGGEKETMIGLEESVCIRWNDSSDLKL